MGMKAKLVIISAWIAIVYAFYLYFKTQEIFG